MPAFAPTKNPLDGHSIIQMKPVPREINTSIGRETPPPPVHTDHRDTLMANPRLLADVGARYEDLKTAIIQAVAE